MGPLIVFGIDAGGARAGITRKCRDNLGKDEDLALAIDNAVRYTKKEGWIGNRFKERELEIEIKKFMGDRSLNVKDILEIVKNQDEYQ